VARPLMRSCFQRRPVAAFTASIHSNSAHNARDFGWVNFADYPDSPGERLRAESSTYIRATAPIAARSCSVKLFFPAPGFIAYSFTWEVVPALHRPTLPLRWENMPPRRPEYLRYSSLSCILELSRLSAFTQKVDLIKLLRYLVIISAIHLLQAERADAEQPAKLLPETKVVLRISRKFIHELTGRQFKHDEPIDKITSGATVTGSAHADGVFDVKLQESDNASDFVLMVNGEVLTRVVAASRPLKVYAHGVASFAGRRRIVFDGNAFTGQITEMNVTYHSNIDQFCPVRGGMIGALTRDIARPIVRRKLPEADREVGNEIRTRLATDIEKETDQLILTLNKVGPLLTKGEQILHEENVLSVSSVHQYLAATEEHFYLSIGPPGQRIPSLPELAVSKRGPIELWIAISKPSREDLLTPVLKHWDLIKPLVLQRIALRSPELGKIVEQVQVDSVAGWYVVTFAPKLLELP